MTTIWSAAARAELARIADFNLGYSERRAGYIDARLVERGDFLGRFPLVGRPTRKFGVRQWSIADVQYVIEYQVEADGVTILRVHHTRESRERP